MSRAAKTAIWVVAVLLALGAVGAFVMWGPPAVGEQFAKPEFCARCHVMKPQYESWQASNHSQLESCNDCHLPNNNFVRHWFWDGVVGVRDVVEFNFNLIPEHIDIKPRSADWVQENCYRCHAEVVQQVHPNVTGRCWECHRSVYHGFGGRRDRALRQPSSWEDKR